MTIDKVKRKLELDLHMLCLEAERLGYLIRVDLKYDPADMTTGRPEMIPDVRPTRARMVELAVGEST